jgi:hypothetical protein
LGCARWRGGSTGRLSLEPSVSSVTWNVVDAKVPLAAADEE